jgi:hypothetical protein
VKRDFKKGDLVIMIDVYSFLVLNEAGQHTKTADWHEDVGVVTELSFHAHGVLRKNGKIEHVNPLFLFDPTEYFNSTYSQLSKSAMEERFIDEKIRWRKHSKNEDAQDNRQTSLY